MRNFDLYPQSLIDEKRLATVVGGGRWAIDWIGGDGSAPGWWRIMHKGGDWPDVLHSLGLRQKLEAAGLVGVPISVQQFVIAVRRWDWPEQRRES